MFLRIGSLCLVMAYGTAYGQSTRSVAPRVPPAGHEEIQARGAAWYTECMQIWDAATHMSKGDWSRTCRRVVDERVKWLVDFAKEEAKQQAKR